jgi:hypothetical protein
MLDLAFHVAPRASRKTIRKIGLVASEPNGRWVRYGAAEQPEGVYVWLSQHRARRWARDLARLVDDPVLGANDVWAVDVTGLDLKVDPVLGDQGARYLSYVGPARLLGVLK